MSTRARFLVYAVGGATALIAVLLWIGERWLDQRLEASADLFGGIVVQVARDPAQSLADPGVQRELERLAHEQATIAARGLHARMLVLGALAVAIAALGSMLLAERFVGARFVAAREGEGALSGPGAGPPREPPDDAPEPPDPDDG